MSVHLRQRSPFAQTYRLTMRRNRRQTADGVRYDETAYDVEGDFYPLLGEQAEVLGEGEQERQQYGVQILKADGLSLEVDDVITRNGVDYLVRKVRDWEDFWEGVAILPERPV